MPQLSFHSAQSPADFAASINFQKQLLTAIASLRSQHCIPVLAAVSNSHPIREIRDLAQQAIDQTCDRTEPLKVTTPPDQYTSAEEMAKQIDSALENKLLS